MIATAARRIISGGPREEPLSYDDIIDNPVEDVDDVDHRDFADSLAKERGPMPPLARGSPTVGLTSLPFDGNATYRVSFPSIVVVRVR